MPPVAAVRSPRRARECSTTTRVQLPSRFCKRPQRVPRGQMPRPYECADASVRAPSRGQTFRAVLLEYFLDGQQLLEGVPVRNVEGVPCFFLSYARAQAL